MQCARQPPCQRSVAPAQRRRGHVRPFARALASGTSGSTVASRCGPQILRSGSEICECRSVACFAKGSSNVPTGRLANRSVAHQRHQHARRGCRGREHEGYCKRAQIRPVPAPVGGRGRRRHAAMRSMRGGVRVGRQGHGLHFSRCATTHHTCGMCVNQLQDLTGPDSGRPLDPPVKALGAPRHAPRASERSTTR